MDMMQTIGQSQYCSTRDQSIVPIKEFYNDQYQRLIPALEIDDLSIAKISRILWLEADKIAVSYANNVIARYEKYVFLCVGAIRGEKVEIDWIYLGTALKNEKGSASYIVRWRKKKLEFLITPQPNDEFEIRNEARLALHGQIVFPDTEYGSWTATFVQPESAHGCLLMLHDPHDEVGR